MLSHAAFILRSQRESMRRKLTAFIRQAPAFVRLAVAVPLACAFTAAAYAQAGASYAVQLTATPQDNPPALMLTWPEAPGESTHHYALHRRTPGASTWGEPIATGAAVATLENGSRAFTDATVEPGFLYEYKVAKLLNYPGAPGQNHMAYGYLLGGIRAPLVENRGGLVLVVERSIVEPLAPELARLENDLIGDGWRVYRVEVGRGDDVRDVKARIKQIYDTDRPGVRAVFLLGRVPVPYSGNFQPSPPDGHSSWGDNHRGAWPADVYYADMDGEWTDHTERYINETNARGTNVPDDGKFDQSYLPSDLELQIGRVDLSSLPGADAKTPWPDEVALLKRYLDKNHAFRHGALKIPRRALVGDSHDANNGRAYAASAYRSFAPLLGPGNLEFVSTELATPAEDRWINRLAANAYLWTFGAGGGGNTSVSSLGHRSPYNTLAAVDLVEQEANGVFHLFFGSWFGDWDQPDNLMRTALTTKFGLASAWSGRPHLVFHAMGLGETLGYCIRASQNNQDSYENQINTFRRGVHIALMGDPTLRLYPLPPPTELQAAARNGEAVLAWKRPAAGDVIGYHVYRATGPGDPFTRITEAPIAATGYTDGGREPNGAIYMVRAVTLETTPSGSYYNASQGVFAKAEVAP
jgi:hypothetical protein